jgi:acylpyruvate hydrolase
VRLATVRIGGGTRAARVEGERLVLLGAPDVVSLLASPRWQEEAATGGSADGPALEEADLAPVVRPARVVCVGLNYRSHILETGRELPEYPTLFAKFPDTLLGPRDDLVLPAASERVDWEAELGVVVGRTLRRAGAAEAEAAIAGFTAVNDVSMRDWQRRTLQWFQGKNFEATTPVGPVLTTPDEVGQATDLKLRCTVDGEVVQEASTADLLFGPAEILAYVSTFMTLHPGDLVATGTPGGVGAARTPPVFLRPGQVVEVSLEGIGSLVNRCVAEAS